MINPKTHFNKSESFFYGKILFSMVIASTFLYSCGNSKKDDFDLSNFKPSKKERPKKIKNKEVNLVESSKVDIKDIKNELIPYKNKNEILNSSSIGKVDPFSEGEFKITNLSSNIKLTGFLSTTNDRYAFVNYKNNEGTLTENSIGGVNSNLLPVGARVISIDPFNMKLTIEFEGEEFNLKLQ